MGAPCQQIASTCTQISVILSLLVFTLLYVCVIFFRDMEEEVCGRNQSSTEEEGKITENKNKIGLCSAQKLCHLVKKYLAKDNECEVNHYKIKRVVHCVEEVKFLCHKFLVRPMCEMTRKKRRKFVLGITNEVTSGLPSTTKRRKRGQYNQGQKIRCFLRPSLCFKDSIQN